MIQTTRRQFLRLLTLGSAGALLAACAPAPAPSKPAEPAKPAATAQPVPTQPPPQVAKPTEAPKPAAEAAKPTAAAKPAEAAKPTSAPAAQVKDVSLVVVDGSEPNSLDPPVGTAPFQHVMNAMYDPLVRWNEKMEAEPALATSWEVSPDGRVWTFKLRPDVKFHDGTPFTSEAVKVSIEHLLSPDTQSSRRASYTLIKEIATPDPLTARITTDPPTPDLPFLMADGSARIISPTALAKHGKDFGRNPVGTGPFKFEEWVPNDHVSAVINEDYWGPKPLVRKFVYRPIPEAAARVVVLRTGEADVVFNVPAADVDSLRQDANITMEIKPSLTIMEAEPRQAKPPFNDVRVRTALNISLDKDAIINNIMRGYARPLNTPSIPGIWGTYEFEPFKYDPNRAKQLLAEAGYPNGIDVTMYFVPGRWAGDEQVVEAMQGFWNNVGIRCTLKKATLPETLQISNTDPNTLPGVLVFLIKSSEFVDYHLYRMYHTDATTRTVTAQYYAYSNPEVDKLLDQQRSTFEPEKRLPLLKQAQELIWKDQPLVYLFNQVNIWGHRKNVAGFRYIPNNQLVPGQVTKG